MTIDGLDAAEVARLAGAPQARTFATVNSTMDEAHRLGEAGAESGALVVADEQVAGRGRYGRRWTSRRGTGLWMTSLHRGVDVAALDCLTIRVGIAVARCLTPLADGPILLKWPNDLLVGPGKVCGILAEARWRSGDVSWVAVGVGINLAAPDDQPGAAGLRRGVSRLDLLATVPAAVRSAAAARGALSEDELREFAARDVARDAAITSPASGVARGITASGALVVDTPAGREVFRAGSLVTQSEA